MVRVTERAPSFSFPTWHETEKEGAVVQRSREWDCFIFSGRLVIRKTLAVSFFYCTFFFKTHVINGQAGVGVKAQKVLGSKPQSQL